MPQDLLAQGQLQHSATDGLTRQLVGGIGLAAAVGFGYFLVAAFSVRLVLQPEGVAVFWPAAGLSSGLLIALGRRARWPVLVGVIVATVATHLIIKDPLWAGVALGLCNGAEALITAGLIQHYFGADFRFARVRNVIGLLAAAVAGTSVSGIGGGIYLPVVARAVGVDPRKHGNTGSRPTPSASSLLHRWCDWTYHSAASRALGRPVAYHLVVSNFVVARRSLSTGFFRGGCVLGFHGDRLDDSLGHRFFRRS